MQAHDLAELAALFAVHSEQLVETDAAAMNGMLTTYWKSSRCRLDRWCRSLAAAAKRSAAGPWTEDEVGTFEEILVAEVLTRVVTALAVAHDQHHTVSESAPVARNIFNAHVDIRRRAIALVVAPHRDEEQAYDLLALRRQCDRWSDLLLAYLMPLTHVSEFAADSSRVGDFAYDAREHLHSGPGSEMAVTMIVAGLRSSLARLADATPTNDDLNLEIATALVGSFSPDVFDSHGHLRSNWFDRLGKVPNDAPVNLAKLWHLTPHGPHDGPRAPRRRW
jgi:hypothetical protein